MQQVGLVDLAGHDDLLDALALEAADHAAQRAMAATSRSADQARLSSGDASPRRPTQTTGSPRLRAFSAKAIGNRPLPASRPTGRWRLCSEV